MATRSVAEGLEQIIAGHEAVPLTVPADGGDAGRLIAAFNAVCEQTKGLGRGEHRRALGSLWRGAEPAPHSDLNYLVVMGVEGFSRLRQQIGSDVADALLRACADRILAQIPTAQIGRVGRTNLEFAFDADDLPQALTTAEALRRLCEQRLQVAGQNFDLHVAIGLADHETCGDAVFECAAAALSQALAGRLKTVAFREADRREAAVRLNLLGELRHAMENQELFLAYQPKLRTRTDGVDVVEALLRWNHPHRGLVPPDDFIGLAEETGLIDDLTRWVLSRAISDQARLAGGGHDVAVHINLSGRLVADRGFTQWIAATVARDAVGVIGLEITETAIIDDPEVAFANLQALADAGLKIAIDDYGSGLSSLAYLRQLPAHELKIDRMFISGLTSSHRDPLLVRSTIDLAHALGMEVTAEGVDSPIALALLRMMGCDLIQGYLISPPLDLPGLEAFLSAGVQLQVAPVPTFQSKIG